METLHKLAGVQDAYHPNDGEQPSQPVHNASTIGHDQPLPPVPLDDAERPGAAPSLHSRRASRVSIPLNRKASHKSFSSHSRNQSRVGGNAPSLHASSIPPTPTLTQNFNPAGLPPAQVSPLTSGFADDKDYALQQGRTSSGTISTVRPGDDLVLDRANTNARHNNATLGPPDAGEETDGEFQFEWGPTHPCFPHPNPHCAPASAEAITTRVIRVRRDWLAHGDLYPVYANLYPEILDPLVSDAEFRQVIATINDLSKRIFEPATSAVWADALLGLVTGYLWDDLGFTEARRAEKKLEQFVQRWNSERAREGKEVRVVQPRRTGFMNLDFVIPDPGIIEDEDAGPTMSRPVLAV
ncbi:uncharacterized protein K489DRAFT_380321 [Dissoconium aciculare CBS 342.82]|jgi:hypothetical protein|uniref:Ras modification protein ERF4 n=1 Tax=Dissoconium aciculare CBS 342.82 TaxID=1314786 RepID=A0A6J3M4V6_9PEZI|nr:uncharacterized protein K489DRAFT_380321 [Dissoconium aciculare CBS 342.82]KAF1822928.1 hypothetical protein K489DRAFT_380321 [Dissoconium aciculare CBS 342.82]